MTLICTWGPFAYASLKGASHVVGVCPHLYRASCIFCVPEFDSDFFLHSSEHLTCWISKGAVWVFKIHVVQEFSFYLSFTVSGNNAEILALPCLFLVLLPVLPFSAHFWAVWWEVGRSCIGTFSSVAFQLFGPWPIVRKGHIYMKKMTVSCSLLHIISMIPPHFCYNLFVFI